MYVFVFRYIYKPDREKLKKFLNRRNIKNYEFGESISRHMKISDGVYVEANLSTKDKVLRINLTAFNLDDSLRVKPQFRDSFPSISIDQYFAATYPFRGSCYD